ncbi:MAG: proton-conducting transporter membrane subunit [Desulfurococcaceae archaeon]
MISVLIGLTPFIPLIMAFTIPLVYMLSRSRLVVMYYTSTALALTAFISSAIAIETYHNEHPLVFKAGGWPPPVGIAYIADRFTALVSAVSAMILLAISIYSINYITDESYPWYCVLLLGNASGILGVLYTCDMFNLFVMLEVTGVSAYALVMYCRRRLNALVSGIKYAFIGSLGTTLYLLAMGLVYSAYGTLNFIDFSLRASSSQGVLQTIELGAISVLVLWAFSIKSGVFPNHFWLPDAHPAAPTPISALLSGRVVNTGLIGLCKFLYLAMWNPPAPVSAIKSIISLTTIIMGCISAIVGSLLMNTQRDVKRLIAYSTIMNLGFLFMGVGCGSDGGLQAALYYVCAHSLAKATLFMSTGVFIKVSGSRDLEKLSGLGLKYPIAGAAFTMSVLALAGIPPLPGFLAKLLLYQALFEYNAIVAISMILASAIGLLAYMKLLYTVLLGTPLVPLTKLKMNHAYLSLLIEVALIVLLGIATLFSPQVLSSVFGSAAEQLTLGINSYVEYIRKILLPLS